MKLINYLYINGYYFIYIFFLYYYIMEITQEKYKQNYDDAIKKLINIFKFKNEEIDLKGSSSLEIMKYYADYDFFINIKHNWSVKEVYDEFSLILRRIIENQDCYFIEFKIEYENSKKKWFYGEYFNFTDFKKLFNKNVDFCKIDIVYYYDKKFIESSCIYKFSNKKIEKKDFIDNFKNNIEELKKEKNYFKILKRLFSIYKLENNNNKMSILVNFFNSEYGKKYKDVNNINAIKLLENYNDALTRKRIELNLNEINFPLDYKNKYNKENKQLNIEAKKIYDNIT